MPSLPPGWLKHDWVELVSIVKEENGTERITTSPIDEARLFDWIKSTQRNSVTPKQYRDALRRMCLDFGAGYRKSQLRDDVRDHLAKRIHELGRKNWACARSATRPRPIKKAKLQPNPIEPEANGAAASSVASFPVASLGLTSSSALSSSSQPLTPPTLLSSLVNPKSTTEPPKPAAIAAPSVPAVALSYVQQQQQHAPTLQVPAPVPVPTSQSFQQQIPLQQQQQAHQQQPQPQQQVFYQLMQQPNGHMMQVPMVQVMSNDGQQMFVPQHQQQQQYHNMMPQQQQMKPQTQAQAPVKSTATTSAAASASASEATACGAPAGMDDYRSLLARLSQGTQLFGNANASASMSSNMSSSMSGGSTSTAAMQQPQLYAQPPQQYQYHQQQQHNMYYQPPQQHFHHPMSQQVQYQQQFQPQLMLQPPQSQAPSQVQDLLSQFKPHAAQASQDLLAQFKPATNPVPRNQLVKTEYRSDTGSGVSHSISSGSMPSKDATDTTDTTNSRGSKASLPTGWLNHEWVEKFSLCENAKGEKVLTTAVIDEPGLFNFIKINKYPKLTPQQYRDALRRMCLDYGSRVSTSLLKEDLRAVLATRVVELGLGPWACCASTSTNCKSQPVN